MIRDLDGKGFRNQECLGDEDFYGYISGTANPDALGRAEAHLAQCPDCRQALADLIELLHPEDIRNTEITAPSKAEIEGVIASIRNVERKEQIAGLRSWRLLRWPLAAAAAICFVAISVLGLKYFDEKRRSEDFFNRARAMLEQSYTGASPGNLRLALPFQSGSSIRKKADEESLRTAENLLYQALAVRGDMPEAHFGLGYLYLAESNYERAKQQFQAVLDSQKKNPQALIGRGVAQYEQVIQGSDPLRRYDFLQKALDDFDLVLKLNPDSDEARYNRIWALFESGRHKDAMREIDLYLSKDPRSVWAEELKRLKIKIQSVSENGLSELIGRAARERDGSTLLELARQAPHLMPGEIRVALRRSLWVDQEPSINGPDSKDLFWAAKTMEAGYSAFTGDHSSKDIIKFYIGLSPPEKETKRSLDRKFQEILKLHQSGEQGLAITRIKSLEPQYLQINDFWQIFNVHHMLGNSLYLGKADFRGAEYEYLQMRRIAERLNAPELKSTALRSLANIYAEQGKFDLAFDKANELRELSKSSRIASWESSAHLSLGYQYLVLGQFDQAQQEYSAALKLTYPLFEGLKIIEALETLGNVMERSGRIKEASGCYQLAIHEQETFWKNQILQPIPELNVRRANLIFRQGDLAMRTGDLAGAEILWRESLNAAGSQMLELEARSRLGLAEVYLKSKRVREAENILKPAIKRAASGQYPDIEWKARFLTGRILEETGFTREALGSFKEAVRSLKKIRQSVRPGDLRQGFLTQRYDPFRGVVRLLAQSSGNENELIDFLDEAKARTLNESLDRVDPRPQDGSGRADEKELAFATLEYFFLDDRLLIIPSIGGKSRIFNQKISAAEIGRQVREFHDRIMAGDYADFERLSRQLYSELISPVEEWISANRSESLVILPDGPLYLLPFAGIQDARGQFLIEKTPVAYAPSRNIFRHCLRFGGNSSDPKNRLLLVNGSGGLPKAQEELAYLSNLYARSTSVVNAKNVPLPADELKGAAIFHFLGHSRIRQGRPALVLQTLPKEIVLDCPMIQNWKMPKAKLVNLAGCSTGIGPVAEGEAPWGLIPAFLDAGAPAIIASLTDVDDGATATLNRLFYDQLKKGASIVHALQRAQVSLLASDRTNPRSWIPYVLIGNPL